MIALYEQACKIYAHQLWYGAERFSPNQLKGELTDEELITIYLFCLMYEKITEKKAMWTFISKYWAEWFPDLPTYQTFNDRLNRLADVFPIWIDHLCQSADIPSDLLPVFVGDSCPIITCAGNRSAKVARNLTDKTYSASKKMWYHGVKLHVLAHKIPNKLPIPQVLGITKASVHDLTALKPTLEKVKNSVVILDKAYVDSNLASEMLENNSEIVTPVKKTKGISQIEQNANQAPDDLFNRAVAKIRQPIESLFNWINEKTGIQKASKVRSEKGLLLHIFGKLCAALILLKQNSYS